MKITKRQLRKLISEEKGKLLNEIAGAAMSQRSIEEVDRILRAAWDEAVETYITQEGLSEDESEELAAEDIMELVNGFLDSVGFRGKMGVY